MKSALFLRHAKSSWADPSLADFERPLKKRGRKACTAMAAYMAEHLPPPDIVLCSPARRTRETWQILAESLGLSLEARIEDALYGAGAAALIDRLRGLEESRQRCLVIGHNPAIQEATLTLAGGGDAAARDRAERKFPTAGLAELTFQTQHWDAIGPGAGGLARFVTPRELA